MNEKITHQKKSLWRVLFAQTQVVFNDNAAKLALVGVIQVILAGTPGRADTWVGVVAILLVLPFVLLSPICGWLTDRYSKRDVMYIVLFIQILVMFLMMAAIFMQSLMLSVFCFFLLAVQSTAFSPAKQGILKELVGSKGLGSAVGWMEMLTMAAILIGSFAGAWAFDIFSHRTGGEPWSAALYVTGVLTFLCVVALVLFKPVIRTAPRMSEKFSLGLIFSHFAAIKHLWVQRPLRLAALGVAYIFSLGGIFYLTILQAGREAFAGQAGTMTESGMNLGMLGLGIAAGAICAGLWCRRRLELGVIVIGGLAMPIFLLLLGLTPVTHDAFKLFLFLMGAAAGIFIVPLNVFLQDNAQEQERGRILAAANLITNIGGIFAVFIYLIFTNGLGLSSGSQFLILVIPTFFVALYVAGLLPESMVRVVALSLFSLFYRVKVCGEEKLPKSGGALLVCNHVSYVDAIILQLGSPRVVRFISYEEFFKVPVLGFFLRLFKTIPISEKHAKDAIRIAAERLAQGEIVCIFPEGELTRTGKTHGFKKGFELIARRAGVPVVPVHLDSLWGSIFSFSGGKYFLKRPLQIPWSATVSFGEPVDPEKATAIGMRQAVMDLGQEAFARRPELEGTIARAALNSLKRHPFKKILVDRTAERKELSCAKILAAALALAEYLRKNVPEQRVGIVLPPGAGGTIANLAVAFAGKIPVNLNVTTGAASVRSSLRCSGVETILSAEIIQKKFPDFPWTEKTSDLGKLLGVRIGKGAILRKLLAVLCLPTALLARVNRIESRGGDKEAVLLFTSGSSGEPKGVVLSHKNILGNVAQINSVELIQKEDMIVASLPLFHSFGLTVTLWYVLLRGCRVVTVPSPLEAKKIGEAAREEKATVLLGTATFLRGYMRKLPKEDFASIRFAIAGAEKMPPDLYEEFKSKYGAPILEGYGLTETSPVSNVNLPDPVMGLGANSYQKGQRLGSVGRLLPGMTARIIHPETGEELSLMDTGVLKLKGVNIFKEYLGQPDKTGAVLNAGWFVTGDLGRFDEDGFMYIEGRLSRFSKIGGEMVPHGTLEMKIVELLKLDQSEGPAAVVMGVPDENKGESLILLSKTDIDMALMKKLLTEAGIPNLWIPKVMRRVENIPILGSGKLDLAACKEMAQKTQSE